MNQEIIQNKYFHNNIKLPLVEKYRPKRFDDLLFDDFIREKIKRNSDYKRNSCQ